MESDVTALDPFWLPLYIHLPSSLLCSVAQEADLHGRHQLYWYPRTAITKDHSLGGLFFHSSGGQESGIIGRVFPFGDFEGEPVPCLSLASSVCLHDNPQFVGAWLQSLCLFSQGILHCVCISVCLILFYKKSYWIQLTLLQHDLILTYIHLQRSYF